MLDHTNIMPDETIKRGFLLITATLATVAPRASEPVSPFHHHLEMKGMSETRIGIVYFALTLIGGVVSLVLARGI